VALTVRPDDEVYQFDTVWLGPDEYTLPIQARYVAWGTWLACFLVAVVILVPLGGKGPGGVLGSLIWSLAVSVVLSRAVMLVVDHERPLRSLPALFSAEARAALSARGRSERALLLKVEKVTVRDTPEKVLAMRRKAHERAARKWAKHHPEPTFEPVYEVAEPLGPDWRTGPARPEWTPELPPEDPEEPALAWTVPSDQPADRPAARVPVPVAAVVTDGRSPAARTAGRNPAARNAAARNVVVEDIDQPSGRHERPEHLGSPFREQPGPVTVSPTRGRHAARDDSEAHVEPPHDRQAAIEARLLLPVRKDR
jgi:hypothetical protein